MKAWVLWYEYTDHSGAGVLRVYFDEKRATEDYDLLDGIDDGKEYYIERVPVMGEQKGD